MSGEDSGSLLPAGLEWVQTDPSIPERPTEPLRSALLAIYEGYPVPDWTVCQKIEDALGLPRSEKVRAALTQQAASTEGEHRNPHQPERRIHDDPRKRDARSDTDD